MVSIVIPNDSIPNDSIPANAMTDAPALVIFDDFCRREYATIRTALGWSLGNHELAGDATDEAFARALERWDRVGSMDNPAGWVYRVGQNWAHRRRWRTKRESDLFLQVSQPTFRNDYYPDPDLASALVSLPMKQRSVVVLRHLLGYSERETAEIMGISPGTVKSRLSRSMDQLRYSLADTGDATEEG